MPRHRKRRPPTGAELAQWIQEQGGELDRLQILAAIAALQERQRRTTCTDLVDALDLCGRVADSEALVTLLRAMLADGGANTWETITAIEAALYRLGNPDRYRADDI